MLRIEIGTLRETIYLEQSPYESGAEIRIQFWNDHRPSAIGETEKPELQEISNDRKIFANDIIAESEWTDRSWSRYLYRDTVSIFLEEDAVLEDTMMKIAIGQPTARVHRTKMNTSNDFFGLLYSRIILLSDWYSFFMQYSGSDSMYPYKSVTTVLEYFEFSSRPTVLKPNLVVFSTIY